MSKKKATIGLTKQEALKRLKDVGLNILPEAKKRSRFDHFFDQFKSPLIYILVGAGSITTLLGDYKDTLVIFAAVGVNTLLGYYQETKAEASLQALKKLLDPHINVFRSGKKVTISTSHVVPGDVVLIAQGDKVPADGILIESTEVSVNESMLTGESEPVSKKPKDRLFMGTIVLNGHAKYEVTSTGRFTEMGKIAQALKSADEEQTPLQIRLNNLAKMLAGIVLVCAALILVIGIGTGRGFIEMFTTSVALAVAAIPEGMAVSLTVILAIGMQRIHSKKALVRKLVAAETLGSVTVIATDKTGTLTEGLMKVSKTDLSSMTDAMKTSVYANNLEDPLEIALWNWVRENGEDPQEMSESAIRLKEESFNSNRKYMSVKIKTTTYIKGAPEVLLEMSGLSESRKKKIQDQVKDWSENGLRVIALMKKTNEASHWIGLVGFEDPVRDDISNVIESCLGAGISIKMITGDYSGTAAAIWKQVYPKTDKKLQLLDGSEIEKMSDDALSRVVMNVDIFARVSPQQKLRIVRAMKDRGEVVALVGDGVNDAPAIKEANIGIVVGTASEVSKETADMVLLDSNFKTIVLAIEEGRGIFVNMQKVILYLLSDSFTEIILVVGSLLLGLPLPLTAAQILWINVVTDGFPAVALTAEPKDKDLLKRKPIPQHTPLVSSHIRSLIGIISGVTGILSLVLFAYILPTRGIEEARSLTFAVLAISTLVYIFSVRSQNTYIWETPFFNNKYLIWATLGGLVLQIGAMYTPFLQVFLQTSGPNIKDWMIIIVFVFVLIALVEIMKYAYRNIQEV